MQNQFLTAPPGELPNVLKYIGLTDLPVWFGGNVFYVDPINGSDTNPGTSATTAFQSLAAGYAALRSGFNDLLVLIGNGAASGSARITANFTWSKNAAHLIGVCSGSLISPRARIAPVEADTAFADLFTLSGSGCLIANIEFWDGFNTGTTSEICMTVSGSQNVFSKCHFAGMGDTTGAGSTGSRSLLVTGQENYFDHCTIGIDTVSRGVANASVEFQTGSTRNTFDDCIFPLYAGAATVLGILVAASGAIDRFNLFRRCQFLNAIDSGATTMTALSSIAASPGGLLLFRDCTLAGITGVGTVGTLIDGGAPAAHATISQTGLAVVPYA